MKRLLKVVVVLSVVTGTWWVVGAQNRGGGDQGTQAPASGAPAPQGRQGAPAGRAGGADPYAINPAAGALTFPLAAPAGKDSNALTTPPMGAVNQGPFDPATWKYGTAFDRAAGLEDLESGEAQDDAGRQGHRRHVLRRRRRVHLLRDGQRRLRLHLDRDAARPARLGNGRANVAHVPARQGGAGRARRLRRRARDPARDGRGRAGDRGADGRHRRGGDRGAQLDLLPAARPAQRRRRPGVRRGDVGRRARRLPQHRQRQHRADPDDRDAGRA